MDVMRKAGEDLREDPTVGFLILEPIEILGVENFADSAIVIRGRLKTKAGKQWDVKRAYMLLIKSRFDDAGIKIPFPTVMQLQA